jgi:CRP/FNR family cyclic AMP-dependent transcriptional regulator
MLRRPIDEDLARVPLFAELSKAQLRALSALATPITVHPGRVLMREGEAGKELMVIVEGKAEVQRGGNVIATRGPGDFFGEIALLLDLPRTASVIAQSEMKIEVIDRRSFKVFLQDNPQLYEPLLQATAARLAELETDTP